MNGAAADMKEIINKIVRGGLPIRVVYYPEGCTVEQMAEILSK